MLYSNINKQLFSNKAYKNLKLLILVIYMLFILVYITRETIYNIDNSYFTLLAWVIPNLIPSFLFTLIGIFYVIPIIYKSKQPILRSKFVWIINLINISAFVLMEYLHVILNLGFWDNLDIAASLIGIIIATSIYYNYKTAFIQDTLKDK